jgi:hypothetical protein
VTRDSIDRRNFNTLCWKTADFIVKVRSTLTSLVVVFEEGNGISTDTSVSSFMELDGSQRDVCTA